MFCNVIFDLDGTLLDTLCDIANAGNHALAQLDLPQHAIECYKKMVGNGFPRLVERMLPAGHTRQTYEIAYRLFSKFYNQHAQDCTTPYPRILEMLSLLQHHDIRLSVLSNKAHANTVSIVEHYFPNTFALVMGLQEGFAAKPDPGSALEMMRQLGADRQHTLYVGDSDVDMQTATNTGLPACGVLWGFRKREELEKAGGTFFVASPEELGRLILYGGVP